MSKLSDSQKRLFQPKNRNPLIYSINFITLKSFRWASFSSQTLIPTIISYRALPGPFGRNHLFFSNNNAPINVMPAGGEAGHRVGIWLFQSNSLPTGKSFQSNATKFPHLGLHIAVNPKAEPKKGTIKISLNKTLQSFIKVAASPKIHDPVTAAIIRFNHNPCYTA